MGSGAFAARSRGLIWLILPWCLISAMGYAEGHPGPVASRENARQSHEGEVSKNGPVTAREVRVQPPHSTKKDGATAGASRGDLLASGAPKGRSEAKHVPPRAAKSRDIRETTDTTGEVPRQAPCRDRSHVEWREVLRNQRVELENQRAELRNQLENQQKELDRHR